jgi:ActR/RegA family two-component response regulator
MYFRPCLVMGYVDSAHAAQCARVLRRQGWEVHCTPAASEVPELLRRHTPSVAVIDSELSHTLAERLASKFPATRVIVLGDGPQCWHDAVTCIPRDEARGYFESEMVLPQWA